MKLKKRFNKIVSWVLCLAMVFNLMPVFPALGAPDLSGQENHKGIVFGYEEVNATSNASIKLAKVTIYVHNVDYSSAYNLKFQFDQTKLALARNDNGVVLTSSSKTADINKAIVVADVPASAAEKGAEGVIAGNNDGLGAFEAPIRDISGLEEGKISLGLTSEGPDNTYYDTQSGTINFKFPEGELVELFSLYFASSGGGSIPAGLTQEAFGMYVEAGARPDGGDVNGYDIVNDDNVTVTMDEPLWVGFKQPAAPKYDVNFKVTQKTTTGEALSGATVVISGPNFPEQTYTTNSAGLLLQSGTEVGNIQLEAGTYTYKITPPSTDVLAYTEATFDVSSSQTGAETKTLVCKKREMGTYPFTVKVLDGDDNNAALSGVTVLVDGKADGVAPTGSDGTTTVERVEQLNAYPVKLSKTGYVDKAFNVTVKLNGNGTITVSDEDGVVLTQKDGDTAPIVTVTMARQQKLITVPVKDASEGNALIPGSSVTVTAKPGGTVPPSLKLPLTFKDESDGTTDGNVTLNLPNGDYQITINAPGYESSDAMDLKVEETQVTLGSETTALTGDNAATVTVPADNNLVAVNGPLYIVDGKWDDDANPTKMTVTVELQNIKATHGTFGLRYDTRIFDFGDFQIHNATNGGVVAITNELVAEAGGALSNPDSDTTYGKHLFSWKGTALDTDGVTAVDALTNKVLIGTYTLNVKAGLSAADINALLNNESLFVVPIEETTYKTWADTKYAKDPTMAQEFLEKLWRTADAKNELQTGETELPEGRLAKDMATGRVGAEGFYQAFPVKNTGDDDDSVLAIGYDVRTQITFPNPENNQRAEFIVTDDASGDPIQGATVKVYKETATAADTATADELLMTLTTDAHGEAFFSADQDTTYKYIVEKNGYWPFPGDLDNSKKNDLQTLTIAQDTVREEIQLKAKIYHPVQLVINQNGVDPETPATSQDAEISGEEKAYNGLDYTFNIQPKPGKEWAKDKPNTLPVVIKGANTDGSDKEVTANLDTVKNIYVISGDDITGDPLDPDTDPLKAGDLIIKITDDYFQDAQYTITAVAEGNGNITAPVAGGTGVTVTDTKHVTQTIGGTVTSSDEFVFSADNTTPPADGQHYGVAKVVINGVDVSLGSDKGKTEYKYTFNDVASDQTITVIFGKFTDDEPSTEIDPVYNPVVTVIGSEFGTITHDTDAAKKGDRFDYTLTKTGDSYGTFNVTITPDSGYAIDKIVVDGTIIAIDGADKALTDVKATATSTSTGGASNDQVTGATLALKDFGDTTNHNITATFKTIDGPSIQAIVTSSIKSGVGTVVPFGVSVYNLGDTPSYSMTAAAKHQLGEVLFNGAKVDKDTDMTEASGTYTYKLPALTGDSTLVVTFDEQAFTVKMKVQFYLGNDPKDAINPANPAKVTFVRQGDKATYTFDTKNTNAGIADVDANVPVGTWDITVTKNGFLNYIITDFVVSDDKVVDNQIKFGLEDDNTTVRAIELTIGEANRNGRLIALDDLAQVANGLLTGASNKAKEWADLDESSTTQVEDIRYVKKYFGEFYTNETYAEFMAK